MDMKIYRKKKEEEINVMKPCQTRRGENKK
jgi:hypothetical protein